MRTYYNLIQHLKTTFEEDTRVNTVTSDGFNQLDSFRKNVFTLVDIFIVDSPQELNTTALSVFNVEVVCLDIRDVNNEDVNDKFYYNDNRHDIWNETHSILELAKDKLIKDHLDTNITLSGVSSLQRVENGFGNGLDGWSTTWTIEVPKTYNSVC